MVGGRGACFSRGSWNEDPIFFSEVLFVHPTKNTEKNRQTQTNGILKNVLVCWLDVGLPHLRREPCQR